MITVNKTTPMTRVVILDISKVYGTEVYDEAILPFDEINDFTKKYIDMMKYRIVII